ncbi:MAG TPA: hypothetical protein VFJ76_07835 [Solirubrobacterales bacterium]|nr:hypothetical protein [Solirubrobacterales bacterium]
MTGPVNKPLPLSRPGPPRIDDLGVTSARQRNGGTHQPQPGISDDDYARQEEERVALEEARETRGEDFWDGVEARAQAAEFLPIASVDVERVELATDRMLRQEDLALYSEWGVVR